MGKAYSSDLRQCFVKALNEGLTACEAGRRMHIARSTAIRWAKIWRTQRRAEPLPMGGDRRSGALDAHKHTILNWLQDTPDLTLKEIVTRLKAQGVKTSVTSVFRLLRREGMTHKKNFLRRTAAARGHRRGAHSVARTDEEAALRQTGFY